MKIRRGFVSNSSSSSFVCDICNDICESYDDEIPSCKHGHYFCWGCFENVDQDELFMILDDQGIEHEKDIKPNYYTNVTVDIINEYFDGYIPEQFCPLCNFDTISSDDLKNYIYARYNLDKKGIEKEIIQRFENYSEFIEYIKEHKK